MLNGHLQALGRATSGMSYHDRSGGPIGKAREDLCATGAYQGGQAAGEAARSKKVAQLLPPPQREKGLPDVYLLVDC